MGLARFAGAVAAVVFACAVLGPKGAEAAPLLDVQTFHPAPGAGAILGLHGAEVLPHLEWSAGAWIHYAQAPLALVVPATGQVAARLVDRQFTLDLVGAVGLLDYLELGLSVPLSLQTLSATPLFSEVSGGTHGGLGDIRLTPKVRLFQQGPFRVGFALPISFPTGSGTFMGQGSVGAEPRAIFDLALDLVRLNVNLGANIRQRRELLNLAVGNDFAYGAGADLSIPARGPSMGAMLAISGLVGLGRGRGADRSLELMAAYRIEAAPGVSVQVGLGTALLGGIGTPRFRVLGGLSWSPKEGAAGERLPGAEVDSDADGIPDHRDECPQEPETHNGIDDEEGCPDGPADAGSPASGTPAAPSTGSERPPAPGAPASSPLRVKPAPSPSDTDGDGVPNDRDLCPDDPGDETSADGCPADDDGDGVVNIHDRCPDQPETFNGYQDDDGCPDQLPKRPPPGKTRRRR